MENDYMELITRLIKRFDSCYDEYMKGVLELGKEQSLEITSEIVAVEEVYVEMRFWLVLTISRAGEKGDASDHPDNQLNHQSKGSMTEPISKQDLLKLLSLENPLKELANKWWFFTLGSKADFHYFFRNRLNQSEVNVL